MAGEKIRIGISSCLLGEKVRYDGGHQLDRLIRDVLGPYLEFVPVCPEVELGLPTPREALRLVSGDEGPRLVFSRSGRDITREMTEWAEQRAGTGGGEALRVYLQEPLAVERHGTGQAL